MFRYKLKAISKFPRPASKVVNTEGVSMGLTMTMTLEGDQLTRVFSEWTFDDDRSVPEQWREPLVFRKLK